MTKTSLIKSQYHSLLTKILYHLLNASINNKILQIYFYSNLVSKVCKQSTRMNSMLADIKLIFFIHID